MTFGPELEVSLNGMDLSAEQDYYVLPDSKRFLRVVLRRPKPKARERTLLEKLELILRGRWAELAIPQGPYPDLVVIDNWTAGWRKMLTFGSKEFYDFVCYQEDIENIQE